MLSDVLSGGESASVDFSLFDYALTYFVQHSRAIANYSAMRAIASSLMSLKRLLTETSFNSPELERMARSSCAALVRKRKTAGRPYLCPLRTLPLLSLHQGSLIFIIEDIFASYPVDFLDIVDDNQRIRWSTFKELSHEVDMYVSQRDFPLISPKQYSFHRVQLVERVKKILVNIELKDANIQDEAAVRRYRPATRPGSLFPHKEPIARK